MSCGGQWQHNWKQHELRSAYVSLSALRSRNGRLLTCSSRSVMGNFLCYVWTGTLIPLRSPPHSKMQSLGTIMYLWDSGTRSTSLTKSSARFRSPPCERPSRYSALNCSPRGRAPSDNQTRKESNYHPCFAPLSTYFLT